MSGNIWQMAGKPDVGLLISQHKYLGTYLGTYLWLNEKVGSEVPTPGLAHAKLFSPTLTVTVDMVRNTHGVSTSTESAYPRSQQVEIPIQKGKLSPPKLQMLPGRPRILRRPRCNEMLADWRS